MRYISEEQFKKILEKLNVEYRGITKSGEPRLAYNGREFFVGRKEKIRGGEEGYKIDVANKIIHHVALERSKKEKKTPGEISHLLRQELKEIIGADF
jgi:hypothetical protein